MTREVPEEALGTIRSPGGLSIQAEGPRASAGHHRVSPAPRPFRERIHELLGSRDLCIILIRRELQVRYKQTALGVIWVLIQPLVPALIFALVLGAYARLPSAGVPYLLFALTGLVLFGLFSGAANRAGGSLVRDGALIAKIHFPLAVLPIASGLAGVVDFLIGLAVVVILCLAMGQSLTPAVLAIPVIAGLTLTLALGFGLGVAALSAHYRDFGLALPFVLQLLLYASPVAYSMEILPPNVANAYALSPLVALLEAFRWALLGTPPPTTGHILLGSFSGLIIVVVGIVIFSRATRDIADVI